ncbi:MAG: hypothetical protein AUK47_27000 [Deltaproteobacteria bacterium CG2_30_63_29]|nr:MAG: hypothetical protein AUK47_27000 [Deltaproteobacteria bacterium CG2_30_63_29]PIW00461.1 MAG: hypothetical protein COW42_07715 [Deltaproteobacteria bacterium CG17_big_fil_post_rev_8_21_14_2_50_63_7]PJB44128.1 MAG: hypothetical protein CO108_09190 [Deltaproteobacteria bacterium CG_4_9_14_3_um_filter_63_12]
MDPSRHSHYGLAHSNPIGAREATNMLTARSRKTLRLFLLCAGLTLAGCADKGGSSTLGDTSATDTLGDDLASDTTIADTASTPCRSTRRSAM